MTQLTLNELKNGQKGNIISFNGGHHLVNKLNSMGIRIGKRVTIISDSFIGGPVTVQIDNSRISIGRGMASKVIVGVDNSESPVNG